MFLFRYAVTPRFLTAPVRALIVRSDVHHLLQILPWLIIGFGIALRCAQYLANRSLWLDESFLALNVVQRSFAQLWCPLDHVQGAPIGFLLIEKLAVQSFGNNEYALRLFPFLCGILSLFLFYKVATLCIKPKAILIGLGLFALSGPLISYSSEVKQYSSDVTIALLLYWVSLKYWQQGRLTLRHVLFWGVLGAVGIWYSHPSVFLLAGIGGSFGLLWCREKRWKELSYLSIATSIWVLSFAIFYFISLRHLTDDGRLVEFWAGSFMPLFPKSIADLQWFVGKFFGILVMPGGLRLSGIAALAFIVGCCSMAREEQCKFFLFTFPIFFVLLASGLQKYPFEGRLLLFLVPAVLLLVATGTEQIWERARQGGDLIGVTFIGLLFVHPLSEAGLHLVKPRVHEEIKPVISYVREHWQEGDVLYLYYAASFAFKYYQGRYGFTDDEYIVGVDAGDGWKHVHDLDKLQDRERAWILFSHVTNNEEPLFLYHLDRLGIQLDSLNTPGASVYLYNLTTLPQSRFGSQQTRGEERPNR